MINNKQLITKVFENLFENQKNIKKTKITAKKDTPEYKEQVEIYKADLKTDLEKDEKVKIIVNGLIDGLEKDTGIPIVDGNFSNPSVNGIFVATMVDWGYIDTKICKKIDNFVDTTKEKKTYDIIENLNIKKEINADKYSWKVTDYCESTAEIKISSELKSDVIGCISYHIEKNNVLLEKDASKKYIESIKEWLNKDDNKGIFYDVIEFNIITNINLYYYVYNYISSVFDEKIDVQNITLENLELDEKLENLGQDLYKDAVLATDVISEKTIFNHILNSFKLINRKSEYLVYNYQKYELIIEDEKSSKLNEEITLNSVIKCDTATEVKLEEQFTIVCDSDLFNLKYDKKGQTCKKDEPLNLDLKLKPNVQEIIKRKEKNFQITIKLIKVRTKKILAEKTIQITIEPLSLNIEVKGSWLPMKGEPFPLNFEISESPVPVDIKVKCVTNDFDFLYPALDDKHFTIPVRDLKDRDEKYSGNKNLHVKAKRIGVFGSRNVINCEFYLGGLPLVSQQLRMTILPNFLDLIIVFITSLFAALSVIYPGLFPSLKPGVDVGSLSSIGGVIYILYRVLVEASRQGSGSGTPQPEEGKKQ